MKRLFNGRMKADEYLVFFFVFFYSLKLFLVQVSRKGRYLFWLYLSDNYLFAKNTLNSLWESKNSNHPISFILNK